MTYAEKLKDPRWQRKRLEAMQEADFACEMCFSREDTLHVHHKQYFKGREPWEYEVGQLAVLCESCHEDRHDEEDLLHLVCSYLPLQGPASRETVASLISGYGFAGDDSPLLQIDDRSGWSPDADHAGTVARAMATYMNIHDLIALSNLAIEDPKRLCSMLAELTHKEPA